MSEDNHEGVLSQFASKKSDAVARREMLDETEDTIERRERILARTSLSAYQVACLKDVPIKTIRKAWFTLSHLLLEDDAMIAVMGCNDGSFAYAMAVLNPNFHIIGLDYNRAQITAAKKMWHLPNLEFVVSKISKPSFPDNSLDAIVDSFTLHEIYSYQGYSEERVRDMLDSHFGLLKQNGLLFLRDFIHPPPGEYVMIEFPDIESIGEEPDEMSEADLLVRFSEEARGGDGEGRGFFLEELEPYAEGTRLFRLPFKWAYEFILRKDNRDDWEFDLDKEYTFMTARELRKTLRSLEARVVYTAPYYDTYTIRSKYEGHFNLYDDDGYYLGYPATSHVFLAKKVGEGESINLQERRPSYEPIRHLRFESVRNNATGGIMDLVSRDVEVVEFLPYRISDNGRLHIFLHESMPRAITNAVPRRGKNLDDKRWSGHMVEAISIDREILAEYPDIWTSESTHDFALRQLGLRPANNAIMEQGPEIYPHPGMIDERIETKFLNVQKTRRSLTPRWVSQITKSFSDTGKIKEYDAQHVLNAITVGLIPSARLERQILALFSLLGIAADNWADTPLYLEEADVPTTSYDDLVKLLRDDTTYFESSPEAAGNIRSLHSYFVDEGYENGVVKGLAARDIEFVISENQTVNTAVVLPLMKDMNGEVLAGYIQDFLPVPERMGKKSKTIRAPSFNLPPEVKDMNTAKAYVAEQFGVDHDRVISLGESYFIHNGMTPQRTFPFAVTANVHGSAGPMGGFTEYAPIRWLWILVWHLYEESYATILKRAMEAVHVDMDFGIDKNIGMDMGQEHARWMTPAPIGLPIPSSPQEHEMIAAEYRSSKPMAPTPSVETPSEDPHIKNTGPVEGQNIYNLNDPILTEKNAGSGDSGSSDSSSSSGSSSSGSSGGWEKVQAGQENKQNQQQKKPGAIRRFENIDYSNIDGDKQRKEAEASRKKKPVISILRPPPSRKTTIVTPSTPDTDPAAETIDTQPERTEQNEPKKTEDRPEKDNSAPGEGGTNTTEITPPVFEK